MKRFLVSSGLMLTFILLVLINGIYADSEGQAEAPKKDISKETQKQEPSSLSGKVIESMDSGSYTYVMIEKDNKKTWVAVPKMKVTVGQEISFKPGAVMSNFTSKTLNRTFETIIFSAGPVGQQGMESMSKSADGKQSAGPGDKPIKVEKASGPDAYTVAEIYEKSTELNEKKVVIRGQVVKFSSHIMGKNWMHIQDGSGDSSKGTNDILVTSQDSASVGDIVTADGTLYKDKDFGSGYHYAVIVEQANIKK